MCCDMLGMLVHSPDHFPFQALINNNGGDRVPGGQRLFMPLSVAVFQYSQLFLSYS